jgi:hypothetical protein
MPQWSRIRKTLLCTPLMALLPAAALAQNKEHSIEVGIFTSFLHFDSQAELDTRFAPTVLVGYNFTKKHGGEFLWTDTTATPDQGDSFPVDVTIIRFGYTYNAYPKEKIVSFFRLGAGIFKLDPEENAAAPERLESSENNPMIYSGGGIRLFIKPWIAVRVAGSVDFIDAGDGFANADVQGTADFGLSFVFGGRESVEKPEETPPAEGEAKPAEPPKTEPPKEEAKPPAESKPPVS